MERDRSGDDTRPRPAEADTPVTPHSLDGLRQRLVSARAQRGSCPPLAEIQRDLLPSREARPGREERLAHLARCTVCGHRARSWRESWEGRAAYLAAAARAGSQRFAGGTGSALSEVAKRMPRRRARKSKLPPLPPELQSAEASPPAEPPRPARAPAQSQRPAAHSPRPASPQASTEYWSDPAREAATPPAPATAPRRGGRGSHLPRFARHPKAAALPALLVFEAPPPGVVPDALLAAVGVRGGAVVAVDSVEEIFDDADFAEVRAIVLTRSRPLAEWPTVLASVRERAPGRLLLAIVPAPRFGPAAVSWAHDPAILLPPVSEKDWGPALHRGGWLSPA